MITEALLTYVREQLAAGSSRDAIENNLRANGWTDPDISQAFAKPEEPTQPAPVMPIQPASAAPIEPVASPAVSTTPTYSPITAPKELVSVSTRPASHTWRIPAIIAACVLVGGGGAFAAYQYRGALFSSPAPFSPEEILQQSFSVMTNLSSVTFAATSTAQTSMTGDIPVSGTLALAFAGSFDRHAKEPLADVNMDASFSSTGATTTGSGTLSLRGVYANSDLYVNLSTFDLDFQSSDPKAGLMLGLITGLANGVADSIKNKWIKTEATSTVPASAWSAIERDLAGLAAYIEGGSYVTSLEDLGSEKVGGIETRHLSLAAVYEKQVADLLLKLANDSQSTTTPEKADEMKREAEQWIGKEMALDLWIGAQDKYLYKVKAAPMTIDDIATGAHSTVSLEISFRDHGKAFSIVPPADAGSLADVMEELFGGFLAPNPVATSSKKK